MTKFTADLTLIFRSGAAVVRTVSGEADGEEAFVTSLIETIRQSETPILAGIAGAGGFMVYDVVGIDVKNVRVPEAFPRPKRRAGTKSGTVKRSKGRKAA